LVFGGFFHLVLDQLFHDLRKQLYPLGKGNYPTLVQKHFNGAETWLGSNSFAGLIGNMGCFFSAASQEAAVLAIWLKGITLAVASKFPTDVHSA